MRAFTVGRAEDVGQLGTMLADGGSAALLLKADYGSGKSHLLSYIREQALSQNYAVSQFECDANTGVRFNRMDQIFGAVVRNLCVPGFEESGPTAFFDRVVGPWVNGTDTTEHNEMLKVRRSEALKVALRAWRVSAEHADDYPTLRDEIAAWLSAPWDYRDRRKWLYEHLVEQLPPKRRDKRSIGEFCYLGVFEFSRHDHSQAWEALSDLDLLAQVAGLRGLVLLVDEFEDVLQSLQNIKLQRKAFDNLFRLFGGGFPGLSFYAVTPGFVSKCKGLLMNKVGWHCDYSKFDELRTFEISPLGADELTNLAVRIMNAHGIAYGWEPDLEMKQSQLSGIVQTAAEVEVPGRARHTITSVVAELDRLYQGADGHR